MDFFGSRLARKPAVKRTVTKVPVTTKPVAAPITAPASNPLVDIAKQSKKLKAVLKDMKIKWQWLEKHRADDQARLIKTTSRKYRERLTIAQELVYRVGLQNAYLDLLPPPYELEARVKELGTQLQQRSGKKPEKRKHDDSESDETGKRRKCTSKAPEIEGASETKPNAPETKTRKASDAAGDEDEYSGASPPKRPRVESRGLVNKSKACFSNAVLQMFTAAAEQKELNSLLGPLLATEPVPEVKDAKVVKPAARSKTHSSTSSAQNEAAAIRQAAASGPPDLVSTSRHLRHVLGELQSGESAALSARQFQKVFAHGSADASRDHLDGESFEDTFEYYQAVVNEVKSEAGKAGYPGLHSLFEFETVTSAICSDAGSARESSPKTVETNYHSLTVPEAAQSTSLDLQQLLTSSLESPSDQPCPRCGSNTSNKTKFTSLPEILVVKMDRAAYDAHKQKATKTNSKVALPEAVSIDKNGYELIGAIMHQGQTTVAGHYIFFRKQGETWWLINDARVSQVGKELVVDGKAGESAMLLLKKTEA